jgi:hypothetical protein
VGQDSKDPLRGSTRLMENIPSALKQLRGRVPGSGVSQQNERRSVSIKAVSGHKDKGSHSPN